MKKQDILEYEMHKAYSLIFVQCIKGVSDKVEVMTNKITAEAGESFIILLENTKTVMFNFQSYKYPTYAICN